MVKNSLGPGKETILDSTGIVANLWRLAPKDRGEGEKDSGQYDQDADIFGASGAAAFFRRSALDAVWWRNEVLDETFFAYYEDVDLAWRLQRAGFNARFVPDAVVVHARTALDRKRPGAVYLKNKYLMLVKNARLRDLPLFLLLAFPHEAFKVLLGPFRNEPHGEALFEALRHVREAIRKRYP